MKSPSGSGGEPGLQPGISILHRKYPRPRGELDFRELNRQVAGQVVSSVPVTQKMRIETDNQSLPRRCDLRQNSR